MIEKRKIVLNNEDFFYTLRINRRARSLSLSLRPGGRISLTVPGASYASRAEKFLIEKSDWIIDKLEGFKEKEESSIFFHGSDAEYRRMKYEARRVIKRKVEEINEIYGFSYSKISIKNQKTRWGSCSVRGALSYNFKIAFLPEKYLDYVVAHELCHLKEFNHSERFWDLVGKSIPDYRKIRKEMRMS